MQMLNTAIMNQAAISGKQILNKTKTQNNATKYFTFQVATLSVVQIIK